MNKLTVAEITEYMETKKGVKVEKIEAYSFGKKTAYLINECYRVAKEAKGSFLPSSIGTSYTPKISGRKITKREYNRISGDYELETIKAVQTMSTLEMLEKKLKELENATKDERLNKLNEVAMWAKELVKETKK